MTGCSLDNLPASRIQSLFLEARVPHLRVHHVRGRPARRASQRVVHGRTPRPAHQLLLRWRHARAPPCQAVQHCLTRCKARPRRGWMPPCPHVALRTHANMLRHAKSVKGTCAPLQNILSVTTHAPPQREQGSIGDKQMQIGGGEVHFQVRQAPGLPYMPGTAGPCGGERPSIAACWCSGRPGMGMAPAGPSCCEGMCGGGFPGGGRGDGMKGLPPIVCNPPVGTQRSAGQLEKVSPVDADF